MNAHDDIDEQLRQALREEDAELLARLEQDPGIFDVVRAGFRGPASGIKPPLRQAVNRARRECHAGDHNGIARQRACKTLVVDRALGAGISLKRQALRG